MSNKKISGKKHFDYLKDLEKLNDNDNDNVKIEQRPSYSSFGSTGYTSSRIDPSSSFSSNPNNMTFTAHSSGDLIHTLPPINLPPVTGKEGYYTGGGARYSKHAPTSARVPQQIRNESLEFKSSIKVGRKKNSKAKKERNKKLQQKKRRRRKK